MNGKETQEKMRKLSIFLIGKEKAIKDRKETNEE